MKKLLLTAIAIFIIAFSLNSQIRWGVTGGLNFSTANISSQGEDVTTKSITSFNIGVIGVKPLSDVINLQFGALFTGKGVKYFDGYLDMNIEYHPYYIEVPINFQYVIEASDMKFLPYGGIYLAYGITGKIKGGGEEIDIKFGSDETDHVKPLDFGINLGLCVDVTTNISVYAQYQMGLTNASPAPETEVKLSMFSIGAAYKFGE